MQRRASGRQTALSVRYAGILSETITSTKQMTKHPLLFRMDSGNDVFENMLILHCNNPQVKFLIKHNFRHEDRYAIAEELKSVCQNMQHPRDGKTVYIGSTWRNFTTENGGEFAIRMVYELTERTTEANGQEMLFPETEIDMYWTSLSVSDEDVIALYHNHADSEAYHDCLQHSAYHRDGCDEWT